MARRYGAGAAIIEVQAATPSAIAPATATSAMAPLYLADLSNLPTPIASASACC